jgi:hypothetical protein
MCALSRERFLPLRIRADAFNTVNISYVGVKLVMESLCQMLGIKPKKQADPKRPGHKYEDYWEPSQKLLGDKGLGLLLQQELQYSTE